MKNWYSINKDSLQIEVKVIPRVGKNELAGIRDGRLCVRISSPPENGRANENLRKFLSDSFGCAKSSIKIIKGEKSRSKTIVISSSDNEIILKKIEEMCSAD